MTKVIVMLIYYFGAPATIQGFKDLDHCNRSIPAVHKVNGGGGVSFSATCVDLSR